ncbi:hypothetical protein HMPREF0063_10473 [Aeromicrobium marinum DSM 15272]|uniref:DUF5926 domain-containing protein n=1 Tax=Aeromicrobium marinum DSM 15272 TaxID=585531 RepID=E2S8W5_9ACTN|nr:DUF5926 family protein [Aeromicrobium marinum]EFQ84620.1 hypothetical protein HMPREF0063_10473 [Aeromicrobium marinum DSM 15272]
MGKKSRRQGAKVAKQRMPYVVRTFEGLPGEIDWVALREFVPSATATVTLTGSDRVVRVCSLLPGNGPGLVRPDGEIWLGLQVIHNFGDISRDLAHVVQLALELEPGTPVTMSDPGVGERLQDLVDPSSTFDVEVHEGFDYWLEGADTSDRTQALLEAANGSAVPTTKLDAVPGAYWTQMGERRYLRWVQPQQEDRVLDAFARLHVGGHDALGDDIRLIGMFRAHGLLVPVWETPTGAEALEEPAAALAARLEEALADDAPLTTEQRSARNGLANRQITIR